jgi:hypothetical protein
MAVRDSGMMMKNNLGMVKWVVEREMVEENDDDG